MTAIDSTFIRGRGDYHNLLAVKKAGCVYALTYHFANRFLSRGDRTVDQMVQAARSGKQNIIEGASASRTSRETEIKLYNVAIASLDELKADYEDYLELRGLARWDSDKTRQVREYCKCNNDSAHYLEIAPRRDDTTLANLCIILIFQAQALTLGLLEKAKRNFKQEGGIREEMSRTRRNYRDNNR